MKTIPEIGIIIGSPSDFKFIKPMLEELKRLGFPFDFIAASAHRSPAKVQEWVESTEEKGVKVIIAAAGASAALPGMVAAHTIIPVIGLPLDTTQLHGVDALYSIVQMPGGVPVGTVGINNWKNALYLALRIIVLGDKDRSNLLKELIKEQRESQERLSADIFKEFPELFPEMTPSLPSGRTKKRGKKRENKSSKPSTDESAKAKSAPTDSPHSVPAKVGTDDTSDTTKATTLSTMKDESKRGIITTKNLEKEFLEYKKVFLKEVYKYQSDDVKLKREFQQMIEEEIRQEHLSKNLPSQVTKYPETITEGRLIKVNPHNPEFEIIERAMEIILEGGIIAIPTDTVYGLAVDATNGDAVKKLYDLKGREKDKPIPLLIHSIRMLEQIATRLDPVVREVAETFWPGALTLVVPKHRNALSAVSPGETVGIRLPDNFVVLSIISMVARPLAVTSANLSGALPATNADQVEQYFGEKVDLILDAGDTPGETVSTVMDVIGEKFKVLREGKITREQLSLKFPAKFG